MNQVEPLQLLGCLLTTGSGKSEVDSDAVVSASLCLPRVPLPASDPTLPAYAPISQ